MSPPAPRGAQLSSALHRHALRARALHRHALRARAILLLLLGCGETLVGVGRDGGTDAAIAPPCTPGSCDDGVGCTEDVCGEGGCIHLPSAERCEDGLACTEDRCDALRGCIQTLDHERCGDGAACTEDLCVPGRGCIGLDRGTCPQRQRCVRGRGCEALPACAGRDDPRCDDGVSCTRDRCDPATGRCTYERDASACDDGAFCNGVEACAPFVGCVPGRPPTCDDGDECTLNYCNPEADRCEPIPISEPCIE